MRDLRDSSRPRAPRVVALLACALLALVASDSVAQTAQVTSSKAPALASIPASPPSLPTIANGRANGASLVHILGSRAAETLAPHTGMIGALVAVPKGKKAEDYGLEPVIAGIGRLRAPPARIEAFGFAHPELRLEVAPPLHPLLDRAGRWVLADVARRERGADGAGVMVGVADTGLDVTNPEITSRGTRARANRHRNRIRRRAAAGPPRHHRGVPARTRPRAR